jgi:uroporphyrinogen decarboxylase
MSALKNDRLLRALAREPVDRTPVWLMRQAGRYLPEYRATRAKAGSFLGLATNPELACEVTLQPVARYPLDAAILFSDILMIPKAMGVGLAFEAGEGPRIERPVRGASDIDALPVPDVTRELKFVFDAVALIRRELAGRVPLIGFAGSPWTVATYLIEGGGSRDFPRAKALLYGEPKALHALLAKLARATTDYLNAQVAAGAQAVMIFDTWGGILPPPAYFEFSLAYMESIAADLIREREGRRVPVILFTKGGGAWLERMSMTGVDALGVDWTTELAAARRAVGDRVALQGNLDPGVLFAPPDAIRSEVARVLESYGRGPGHVFNLGHGIQPDVDPEHVAAMVAAVHELSPQYHR